MSEDEATLYRQVLRKHFASLFDEDALGRMVRDRIGC